MIILEIILFLLIMILYLVDQKIAGVHLTKLQNIDQSSYKRPLKNLAYRRSQSLLLTRSLLLVSGFAWAYILISRSNFVVSFGFLLGGLLFLRLAAKVRLLDPVLSATMGLMDKVVRKYDKQLAKLSKYALPKTDETKIYKPYDDKEFKKLITSLHSSDNLVNKKVLGKIENLFKIEYLTVEDMMIPMSKVTVIDEDEYIGPILLDELHKTSLTIFPVGSEGKIIGSVNLSDMKDQTGKTKVKDLTKHEINYIQDDATTQDLIEVFVEYKNEQFLVIDSKESIRGVVNIYQMLELLFDQSVEKV